MRHNDRERRTMNRTHGILKAALILIMSATAAWSQPSSAQREPTSVQTYHLKNTTHMQDGNEIFEALRNTLTPQAKITFIRSQNAFLIEATPDQLALAEKILNELDPRRNTYRLTYTIIDRDSTKRIGEQHYSMIVVAGQRTLMKQGSRVPIMVSDNKNPASSTVTYIDVGMNFEATLTEAEGGASLRTRVERSSTAEEKSAVAPQDPIVRQSLVEGTSFLTLGKPLTIGSLDVPDSTRHLDIEVTIESFAPDAQKKPVKP